MTFVFDQEFFVRYAETDAMGVVHHASYVVYMEEARSAYSRERGHSYAEFEATGHYLVVSELQIRYIAPVRYGEKIKIRCWIKEMKSRRVSFAYEMLNQAGLVAATATSDHICVDKEGNLKRIPEQWRAWVD